MPAQNRVQLRLKVELGLQHCTENNCTGCPYEPDKNKDYDFIGNRCMQRLTIDLVKNMKNITKEAEANASK